MVMRFQSPLVYIFLHLLFLCMQFKNVLNEDTNTPIIQKDVNGLKPKFIISFFNTQVVALPKSVASQCKMGR